MGLQLLYNFAMMKFEQYHIVDEIKDNISKLGYTRPTDIQFKTIPSILKGAAFIFVPLGGITL